MRNHTIIAAFLSFWLVAPALAQVPGGGVPIATTTTAGKVKPDGTTVTVATDGTITATTGGTAGINQLTGDVTAGPASGPAATTIHTVGGKALALGGALTTTGTGAITLAFGNSSATLTFQGTDTYVGRSTTDTLVHKTIDCFGGTNTCLNFPTTSISGLNAGEIPVAGSASTITSSFPLGTGVQTFLTTPSSANLLSAVTGATGTGSLVFNTAPTIAGAAAFTGAPTFAGVTTGTQVDCLGRDASNVLVAHSGGCGTGDLTVTDGTHSVSPTTTLTVGTPFVVSGTSPNASLNLAVGGLATTYLANQAVTYAKIQNGASSGLLGVNSGSAPTEVIVGSGLSLNAGVLTATGATSTTGFGVDGGTSAQTVTGTATINNGARLVKVGAGWATGTLTLPAISAVSGDTCIRIEDGNANGAAVGGGGNIKSSATLTVAANAADGIVGGAGGSSVGPYNNGGDAFVFCVSAAHNWTVKSATLSASTAPTHNFANGVDRNTLLYAQPDVTDVTGAAPLASPTFTGVPAAPTAAPGTNTTQLATTAYVLANGGGVPVVFVGALGGSANAYTLAAPTPSGFTLTNQFVVRGTIPANNTAASTLSVFGTGAKAIESNSLTGLAALSGGELVTPLEYDFTYNTTCTCYVVSNAPAGVTTAGTTQTVSQAQWANWTVFDVTTSGQTLTLLVSSSLNPNGGLIVRGNGQTATVTVTSPDTINGGSAGGSITIAANTSVIVTTDGAGHFYAPLGGTGTGSVTSVGIVMPGEFSVSGSPVTTSGNLTVTKASQTANTIYAGPTTGAAAAPTFRAMVAADIPNTAVSGGTYGDATHIGTFTVGADGRLTSASNVAVTSATAGREFSLDLASLPASYQGFTQAQIGYVIDKITLSAGTFTCSVNPAVTFYECGASTTCASPTTIGTGTITAAGQAFDAPISSAGVTQNDYVAWKVTAGTCSSVSLSAKAEAHAGSVTACGALAADFSQSCDAIVATTILR